MDHRWAGAWVVERAGIRRIAIGGRELTLTEAAEAAGLSAGLLRARLLRGWSVVEALTKPLVCRPRNYLYKTTGGKTLWRIRYLRRAGRLLRPASVSAAAVVL